ncbi:MAG: adenylate/guanylate cyclase domain-containing protein [Candidatus Delongbacteria bacterium]|nr:adenylate/guanylate cyclase domain-containing protein [Candidatus Delongbacteria bacterium]MCG2761160.1 adenylate/guanylate cyclase domain-containing protein [Candidatus Delongbacteria bacterium]
MRFRIFSNKFNFRIKYFISVSFFILAILTVHTIVAIIYGNEWAESFISSIIAFGIINLLLADRIFKPIDEYIKTGKDKESIITAVNDLNRNSIMAFITSSSVYILLRLFLIFSRQELSFGDMFNIFLVFSNRYILLAPFLTYLILSYYSLTLKRHFYEKEGIIFPVRKESLFVKLTATFLILLISPAVDIYFVLRYSGQWDAFVDFITAEDTSLISTFLILLAAIIIALLVFSKEIYRAFRELIYAFGEVRNGKYGYQAVVLTNDEFGRLAEDFNDMSKGLEEREFIRDTFGKYIAPEIAAEVIGKKVNLKGEINNTTVMFTDIADFTSVSERMSPAELVKMLNEYFSFLVGVIQKNNGVVNKFIGDSVMAVFNAPLKDSEHADHSVQAAIEIVRESSKIKFNDISLKTRIGINTGDVLLGNIGAESRLEYTVIGDVVNMASRLEQINKNYNSNIMIGHETRKLLKGAYEFEEIVNVNIKGKKEAQTVYKLIFTEY